MRNQVWVWVSERGVRRLSAHSFTCNFPQRELTIPGIKIQCPTNWCCASKYLLSGLR